MPSSQNGNIGLWSGYTPGDNGWTAQHNSNWDALDTLPQLTVKDNATTTPPGSPANGDVYIVPASATGAWASQTNKLAVWIARNSAWSFFSPRAGWSGYVQTKNAEFVWTGTAWAPMNRGQQTFTSSGTFTVPSNISTIYVSACAGGGGGGGGGSCSSASCGAGGGGGAGQSIIKQAYSVTPGSTIAITIGNGGSSGSGGTSAGSGGTGGAGTNTIIGSLITLNGGSGGFGGGGSSIAPAGGPGGAGYPAGCFGADGPAGAFGGQGSATPYGSGGFGGRGAGGAPVAGNNASGFGGGGGGGGGVYISSTQAGSAGGTGSPGIVIIEW